MICVEYKGHWWLPGEQENRVGGILSFDPQTGADLELFDAFESGLHEDPEHGYHSRLHGVSREGDSLTLVNCYRRSFGATDSRSGQISRSSYQPMFVLDGIHVPSTQNISFTELKVSFPGLKEWSRHTPLSNTNHLPSGKFELELENPEALEAEVMEYVLNLNSSFTPSLPRADTPSISSDTYFRLYPKHPTITLPRLRQYVSSLRDLLTLATNHVIEPKYVQAKPPNSGYSDIGIVPDIDIYYADTAFGQSETPRITNQNFKLPQIPDGFSGLIKKWFELRNEVASTINVFLGTRYGSGTYQQDTFLSLTQAVESYHRRRYDDEYMNSQKYNQNVYPDIMEFVRGDLEDVYDDPSMFNGSSLSTSHLQRLKSMMDAYSIPNDLGNVLDSAVEHANEYSLRKRFKELVNNEYDHILTSLPHSAIGQIHPIVETRNHFTHQIKDQQKDPAVAEGADLTRLSWSVEQLLEVALLSELGVPESQIRETLQNRYRQYRVL